MLIAIWIITWALSFGAARIIGPRVGRRYDALVLTGILGVMGLLIFAATLAADGPARGTFDAR